MEHQRPEHSYWMVRVSWMMKGNWRKSSEAATCRWCKRIDYSKLQCILNMQIFWCTLIVLYSETKVRLYSYCGNRSEEVVLAVSVGLIEEGSCFTVTVYLEYWRRRRLSGSCIITDYCMVCLISSFFWAKFYFCQILIKITAGVICRKIKTNLRLAMSPPSQYQENRVSVKKFTKK